MDLSQEELLSRKETLKQFENYIENATNALNNFVEQIGWTLDETPTDVDALVDCPINSEHRVLPSKLDDHYQTCKLKQNGYDSTHSLYPSYNSSTSLGQTIKIDNVTQMQILKSAYEESNFTLNVKPDFREVSESIERYVCDFTPDERRILYDSAVKGTKLPDYNSTRNDLTGIDVFNKTDENPKTELELLEEQRNLKRRRAAYRGKRVHTDRKSHVEVLREVVEGLTNSLSQQEDICNAKTTNSITGNVSNNRIVYKYAGNKNYDGNPYTRWLDIKKEESKLFKYCEKKNDSSFNEASSSRTYFSKDTTDFKKSRKSRSKSRERNRSSRELKLKGFRRSRSRSKLKETKYIRSKRSRSPLQFNKTKYKRLKIRSKSKETMFKKSRSRSLSIESEYKKSKRHRTRSKSKATMFKKSRSRSLSMESEYKKSKRNRTHSKSEATMFKKSRSRSLSIESEYKKSKKNRTHSKSKSTMFKKSRSRSLSIESEYKKSKRHRTHSKSKETTSRKSRSQSLSIENKYKISKRCRTRSKSKEFSSRRKDKHSKSSINYSDLPLLKENDTTFKFKPGDELKKKNKHKKKRKHSKSPKKSHKSK